VLAALLTVTALTAGPAGADPGGGTPPPSDDPLVALARQILAELGALADPPRCNQVPEPARWIDAGTPDRGMADPVISAHRGALALAPENTLASYEYAFAYGVDLVEVDVQQTADGRFVALHDDTVDRTTDGHGRVAALTLAELQALDAGHCATPGRGRGTAPAAACRAGGGDFPFRGRGHRIPTLDEVLAALPRTTAIMIEVKAGGFEAQVAETLRRSGRQGRLVMGSGKDDVAAKLRRALPDALQFFPRGPGLRLGAGLKLAGGRLSRPDYQVLATPRAALGARIDSPAMLAAARRLGILVAFFTINDEAEIEALVRAGADAIITDYPARARRVIDRLRARTALPR
jgi:glycerophosphoryl diester phosphodiesterase